MDCIELVELVTDYLEQMRLTRLATGNLRAEDVPPVALDAFRNAFQQRKKA
jgi:hypothetical protein